MSMHYQKQADSHQTIVTIGYTEFGATAIPVIAGPCAVESREQLQAVASTLRDLGITCMRAGAYKPRTSPYSFQGMLEEGLKLLREIRYEYGLSIVSEVMSIEQIETAQPYVDCLQVGSRNMQNFELLKALGQQSKPILLKRGLAATVEEFLMAAEYILAEGNPNVILCERGIRSYDPAFRNVLDLAAVALLKERTHLPIIVDPSHATGKRSLITPTSKAALAVGADGLIIEAHPQPEKSISDAAQAISLDDLVAMMSGLHAITQAMGRSLVSQSPSLV